MSTVTNPLGGLLAGMLRGKELGLQVQRAADDHQQLQQIMRQREEQIGEQQQNAAMKVLTDRMNLEMSGARPVNNGMVEDMLASQDAAAPAGGTQRITGSGERDSTPTNYTPVQSNSSPLDGLRAETGLTAPSTPPAQQTGRFTRKADKSRVVSVPWAGGGQLQYELPTREEQISRANQMAEAQQMREKLGAAKADTASKAFVLKLRGQKLDDETAQTLGIDNSNPWALFLPDEIPGMKEKAAQIRKAGLMEVPAGGTVINTGAPGGPAAPGGGGSAAAGASPVVFQAPAMEPPNVRAAKSWYAQSLGKQPTQLSPQEQTDAVQKWTLATMNPLERQKTEGEIKLQPLTAAEKQSQIATQGMQRQIHSQELDLAGDDDTINLAAQKFLQTGQMPALGMGSQLLRGRIMGRAAEQAKAAGLTPEQVPALQDSYKAMSKSLSDLQTRQGQILAFERGGAANLDNFIRLAQKQIDSGSPLVNRALRGGARTITGSPDQAAADAARVAAFSEISKILSGSLGNGAVSDSSRKEAENLLSGEYTMPQLVSVAKVLRQDMKNRSDAYGQQVTTIRQQMQTLTKPGGGKGSGGQISITAPDGSVHTFADQAAADNFKKLAGIQ